MTDVQNYYVIVGNPLEGADALTMKGNVNFLDASLLSEWKPLTTSCWTGDYFDGLSEDDLFSEVETSWEKYISCPDCGRNFLSKSAYNNHIDQCESSLEDDNRITRAVLSRSSQPVVVNSVPAKKSKSRSSSQNSAVIIKEEKVEEGAEEPEEQKVEQVFLSSRGRVVKRTQLTPSAANSAAGGGTGRVMKSNESFECKVCKKVYYTKYGFKLHLRTHTGNKGYTCETCGKSFSQSGHLKDHRRIHTGEKPFVCTICDKRFAQNQNLKHHLRMHSGVKPYECKECGKSFFTKCELTAHERSHTGIRPYPCNMCDKSFAQLHGLKGHLKTHGGAQNLDCPVCKIVFPTLTSLMQHLPSHDEQKLQQFRLQQLQPQPQPAEEEQTLQIVHPELVPEVVMTPVVETTEAT